MQCGQTLGKLPWHSTLSISWTLQEDKETPQEELQVALGQAADFKAALWLMSNKEEEKVCPWGAVADIAGRHVEVQRGQTLEEHQWYSTLSISQKNTC